MILDQLRVLVWMQSKDGHKGKNRPKPLSPLANKHKAHGIRRGRTDRPAEDVAHLLDQVAKGKKWRPINQP